jgi:hypothetical protein
MVAPLSGEATMSFQISGFAQFFQGLFETAPPQPLPVPQHGATLQEIQDFVNSLKLPADLRSQLQDGHLRDFAKLFRVRGIDRNDEGACVRFTKEFLDYVSWEGSYAFLNGRNPQGMTPLMCALKEEDWDLLKELKQHGAVFDGELVTFAIRNNQPSRHIYYLFKFADYPQGARSAMGQLFDSVCLMAERSHAEAVTCLGSSTWRSRLLVHDAANCGHAAVIPLLKDAGFDINGWDAGRIIGRTPLMYAMRNGHSSRAVVEALLQAGASPDLYNMAGESPLTCARDEGLKATALLLIQHGASVTPDIESWINEPDEQT